MSVRVNDCCKCSIYSHCTALSIQLMLNREKIKRAPLSVHTSTTVYNPELMLSIYKCLVHKERPHPTLMSCLARG